MYWRWNPLPASESGAGTLLYFVFFSTPGVPSVVPWQEVPPQTLQSGEVQVLIVRSSGYEHPHLEMRKKRPVQIFIPHIIWCTPLHQ